MVAFATLAVSCNEQQHSIEMHDMEECVWSGTEEFTYDNADSLSKRDISIVVRYGTGYVADSVCLHILAISPDSMVTEEPFTLRIPRIKEVRPEEQTFIYRRNVVLSRKGEYHFRLTPDSLVEGISSIGIMVGEPQQQHNEE
ncbi:MAG: hypothetical protein II204_07160 [Alistipes sp.]|nr:hypothetical protein [Alistipes sp.]